MVASVKREQVFTFKRAEILTQALFPFHFVMTQQVTRLLRPTEKLGNYTVMSTRLKYLVDNNYLYSHHLPTAEGQRPYGFHLARQGKRYLEEEGYPIHIYWEEAQLRARSPGWKMHLLELNDFLITTALLPTVDPTLTIFSLKHDLLLKREPLRFEEGQGGTVLLQPDAIVEIHQQGRDGRLRRYILWVELDRGHNDNEKFQTYLARIYAYISQGFAERDFGTSNITVLFPTTAGERRVERMRELTRGLFGAGVDPARRRNQMFRFASVPPLMHKQSSSLEVFLRPSWSVVLQKLAEERNKGDSPPSCSA
jgi:hypothetical protein